MSVGATVAEADARPRTGWRAAGPAAYQAVVVLWFFSLLAPNKLIPYYIPPARPLSWLPELLLWWSAIQWLRWPEPKRGYPAYTAYMVLMIFGTIVAYFLGNWGVARETIREVYGYYLLGLITLTICRSPERARPLFDLYFVYFLWFGLWGILSLKTSPLGADVDPGARIIVPWHPTVINRDAFGPLMVAGVAYSIYYLQANRAIMTKTKRYSAWLSIAVCGIGFITSFGRGAFLGFLAVATSMWLRSRRKLAVLVGVASVIGVFALIAPDMASRYVTSMQSITEQGTHEGTGADRADLWGIAWREFLSSPLVGVGTYNFGAGAARVLSSDEITAGGYTSSRLFGRAVHSAPMEILAEHGLLGVIIVVLLLFDFFRTNRRIRAHAKCPAVDVTTSGFPAGYVEHIALGLNCAFLAFCISGIFYELLYTPLFWTVIVLNRMLYFTSGAHLDYERAPQNAC